MRDFKLSDNACKYKTTKEEYGGFFKKWQHLKKVDCGSDPHDAILHATAILNRQRMKDNLYNIGDYVLHLHTDNVKSAKKNGKIFEINGAKYGEVVEIHKSTEVLGEFEWYYTIKTDEGELEPYMLERYLIPIK